MYVPEPGSTLSNINGVLKNNAFIAFVQSAPESEYHDVTIKYPSGETVRMSWRASMNLVPFGLFVPKGSTVTASHIAYGFYVVPASSVGGD